MMIPDFNLFEQETWLDDDDEQTSDERLYALMLNCIIQVLSMLAVLFVGIGICALLGSCSTTKYVPVVQHQTDTVWQHHTAYDSIYLKDSVFVNQWQHGDTIYQVRDRWHTQFVTKERHDTIYKSHVDSIPYPVEVIKEVPAKKTWWQQLRIRIGGIVFWVLVLAAVWYVAGLLRKLKK